MSTISVNTVYQKVLALANKEQRGYITPQEFNLFADQAQQEIFDNYFHDLRTAQLKSKNDTGYADEIEFLQEKIAKHISTTTIHHSTDYHTLPGNMYSISTVYLEVNGGGVVERVDDKKLKEITSTPLTAPSTARPVYVEYPGKIRIYPATTSDAVITYTIRPGAPSWGYIVVSGKALYNANTSVDFALHISEENNLVMRILQLAGISTEEQFLTSVASQDAANTEAKKNN